MPRVFEWNGFRFFFYSNEGDPREPVHVHVRKERNTAKFWLHPEVHLAESWGFSSRVLLQLANVIEQHRDEIESTWHDHFS